ncbi:hypothetical protein SBA7_1330001 [Candidatus Sulfotelmatobacter sp. SbA7]|nr:hypothetical protein SBA7_1330001 [Candidatus Sulfotelmatobacter sp. SbA7]
MISPAGQGGKAAGKGFEQEHTEETEKKQSEAHVPTVHGAAGRGGADRPKSGGERRIWKFSKGALMVEPSFAGFGGVVFQGEAKAGKSWRRGGPTGRKGGTRGPRCLVCRPERFGVERSPSLPFPHSPSPVPPVSIWVRPSSGFGRGVWRSHRP